MAAARSIVRPPGTASFSVRAPISFRREPVSDMQAITWLKRQPTDILDDVFGYLRPEDLRNLCDAWLVVAEARGAPVVNTTRRLAAASRTHYMDDIRPGTLKAVIARSLLIRCKACLADGS